jgi:hypothetical protein
VVEAGSVLTPWSNFYIMTGSSAAALTGLMFIVITLVMGEERLRRSPDGISAFSTPTVVHLCAAFLFSAALSAPWHTLAAPATLLGIAGLYGVVFVVRVTLRSRRLNFYTPDAEDWACYSILPFFAYAAVLGGAIALPIAPVEAMFAFAAADVLLIVIGIHNAWDIVTYIAVQRSDPPDEQPR